MGGPSEPVARPGGRGDPLSQSANAPAAEDPRLSLRRKIIFGSGDFTVNTALASLSMVYTLYFLTQYAELRPALAGLIPLIGRTVDAFTDPLMGRLSDRTRWQLGRRRPYFLLGAIPFGVSFAMLWASSPAETQQMRFLYYTGWYILLSLSMTVLSVPYLALIPEMARSYDGRTGLNAFRSGGAIIGIFAAISIRPIATALGGGDATPDSFALTATGYGVMMCLPWFLVYANTWERPEFQSRESSVPLREAIGFLLQHKAYVQLMGLYLTSRIAMDLIGVVLILYFTHVLGRSSDFEITMACFLLVLIAALPFWLAVSRRIDKSHAFMIGACWWSIGNLGFLFAQPDWPRWLVIGSRAPGRHRLLGRRPHALGDGGRRRGRGRPEHRRAPRGHLQRILHVPAKARRRVGRLHGGRGSRRGWPPGRPRRGCARVRGHRDPLAGLSRHQRVGALGGLHRTRLPADAGAP